MHIVLAGFGNMGQALARGWLEADAVEGRITVLDRDTAARGRASELGLVALDSAAEFDDAVDVAVLAVKPQDLDALLGDLPRAALYLSIAAGRTIADIERLVGNGAAIVRAMPNTPAAVGLGVTGLCANASAGDSDRAVASRLMAAVGTVEWLDDEADMDALTAVSGSGPAYVFLLIECLTAAAVDAGLKPGLAERLATSTVCGAGAYAAGAGLDAATLRRQVTSPQGTTEAALAVLMENDALGELVRRAVREAARRSRELAGRA